MRTHSQAEPACVLLVRYVPVQFLALLLMVRWIELEWPACFPDGQICRDMRNNLSSAHFCLASTKQSDIARVCCTLSIECNQGTPCLWAGAIASLQQGRVVLV